MGKGPYLCPSSTQALALMGTRGFARPTLLKDFGLAILDLG
jgi:hypothetical protein